MANFGALGTLRNAYRTLNKPSTSALVRSVSVNKNFRNSRNQTRVIASKFDTSKSSRKTICTVATQTLSSTRESSPEKAGHRRLDPVSGQHFRINNLQGFNHKPPIREAFSRFS
jgi:hypothetical protein